MDIYKCPKSKKFYKYKFCKKRDLQSLYAFGFVFLLFVKKIVTIYGLGILYAFFAYFYEFL
uniref:Uncharacterized protein n=1 Tax=viral metagenome TaxID=1070528 RepID=A0A6C0KT62_9ZZZZ